MRTRLELDAAEIDSMIAAANDEASCNSWAVSIAVVDEGGHLLAFRRLPGASRSSVQISIDKARSASLTRRPTSFFEQMLQEGKAGTPTLHDVIPMAGGLPIEVQGQVVGGIAVSGVKSEFDVQIAQAGLNALS
ncbi:GlcG/HbpS family heme-binding protein [Marinobacterium lutimaris]|uniref:Glc operon protein GlcG n=1 Tax=Marinobacterium lutimaris TaxID=568106 RepID=A0A1H6DSJ5_9GAMM|nr:heme-binding protein [Marinobacterium lutimaris]SEG88261.1 glc operon protein GlcG [Marinobacterium lutimaris]